MLLAAGRYAAAYRRRAQQRGAPTGAA